MLGKLTPAESDAIDKVIDDTLQCLMNPEPSIYLHSFSTGFETSTLIQGDRIIERISWPTNRTFKPSSSAVERLASKSPEGISK